MLQIMYKKYPLYIVSNSQSGYIEVFFRHQVLKNISKVIFVMEIPVWTKAPISVNLQTHMI